MRRVAAGEEAGVTRPRGGVFGILLVAQRSCLHLCLDKIAKGACSVQSRCSQTPLVRGVHSNRRTTRLTSEGQASSPESGLLVFLSHQDMSGV